MNANLNTARGTLFGVAFGDALGKPTEFVYDYSKIVKNGLGVRLALPEAVVTDDTEMTIAVARAVQAAGDMPYLEVLLPQLRAHYVLWRHANVWGRAAGGTCLAGAEQLESWLTPWQRCTTPLGKGCGANMRVAPLGLVPDWSEEDVANAAQLSSALTHGHPVALAAAELTALGVWYLRTGQVTLVELVDKLLDRCQTQRGVYRGEWLGNLANDWRGKKSKKSKRDARPETAARAMTFGWDVVRRELLLVKRELRLPDRGEDISRRIGAGWIAEEALATALYAAVRYADEPRYALQRAAQTSGDSDSLAAIAGSLLGAAYGADAWPAHWYDRIEYYDVLNDLARRWDNVHVNA